MKEERERIKKDTILEGNEEEKGMEREEWSWEELMRFK
jgi:hypothetical protein